MSRYQLGSRIRSRINTEWRELAISELSKIGIALTNSPAKSPTNSVLEYLLKEHKVDIISKECFLSNEKQKIIDSRDKKNKEQPQVKKTQQKISKEYYDGITVKYIPVANFKNKTSKRAIAKKASLSTPTNSEVPQPIGYVSRCRQDEPINLDPEVFYKSWRWRELRLIVLDACGRYCCSCGKSPRPDNKVVLHVDHVKPLRSYPKLALDISNLQVLCEDCNQGKSWYHSNDYRSEEQRNKLIAMKLASIRVTESVIASMHDSLSQ